MSTSIYTLVSKALTSVHAYRDAVEGLRAALKGQVSPEVRAAVLSEVARFYEVKLVASERGEGQVLDADAPKYAAAKQAVYRLVKDIVGKTAHSKTAHSKPELKVPANILEAARKLVALCAEYEEAARLVSTALATVRAE
jgi:hypothetical protein